MLQSTDVPVSTESCQEVKYIHCILDAVCSGLDQLEDSTDPGLLTLLTKVDVAVTYHQYQIAQTLSHGWLKDFVCWAFHRLLLITYRPPFTYHLNAIGSIGNRLLILLERNNLETFLSVSALLLAVLNDVVTALNDYDPSKQNEFELCLNQFYTRDIQTHNADMINDLSLHCSPIQLTGVNAAYRLIAVLCHTLSSVPASFRTLAPQLGLSALHLFQSAVDLGDMLCKERAFDAITSTTTFLLDCSNASPYESVALACLTDTTVMLLCAIIEWSSSRDSSIRLEGIPTLRKLCSRSLNWLSLVNNRDGNLDSLPLDAHQALRNDHLSKLCEHFLSHSIGTAEPDSLNLAVLSYMSTLSGPVCTNTGSDREFTALHLSQLLFLPSKPQLHNSSFCTFEKMELKIEALLSEKFAATDSDQLQHMFEQLPSLPTDLGSVEVFSSVWIQHARFFGSIGSQFERSSIADDLLMRFKKTAELLATIAGPDSVVKDSTVVYAASRYLTTCCNLPNQASQTEADLKTSCIVTIMEWIESLTRSFPKSPTPLVGPLVKLSASLIPISSVRNDSTLQNRLSTTLTHLVETLLQFGDSALFWCGSLLNDSVPCLLDTAGDVLDVIAPMLSRLTVQLRKAPLSKETSLVLAHLSTKVICLQSKCHSVETLHCPGTSMEYPEEIGDSTDLYPLSSQIELLELMLEGRNLEGCAEAVVDMTVHLSCHLQWGRIDAERVLTLLSLVQSNLPHFTTPIVGKIYHNVSSGLSTTNLGAWLELHNNLFNLLAAIPRQGPCCSLSPAGMDDYRIMQYAALACCLSRHYCELMACQSPSTTTDSEDRRTSVEARGRISTTIVSDALISVLTALCRLAIVHQYSLATYGTIYVQIGEIVRALNMKPSHVVRLCREKLAQVVADHMESTVTPVIECLSRCFRVDRTTMFKELISALFIALVLRGNQESHLHIRQVVTEVPFIRPGQDYVNKIVQLCVLPDILVHIFTRTSKDEQEVHFAFLESHLSMPIERIARLNDVSRLMHQFVLRLYPFRVGASLGLRWVASRVLTQREASLGVPVAPSSYVKGPSSADFLGHYVCGILAFFDSTLLDDDTMLEHRWIALRSLGVFIQLLGSSHVTRMRAKFMATLKICLRYKSPPFAKVVIKVWRSFIRMLEPDALRELLPDLGSTLVSLLPCGPDSVTDLFNTLFLEKKEEIGERLSCLFFLPRTPKLLTCQQVLDDLCPWRTLSPITNISSLDEANVCTLLRSWLAALTHSSRSVRRLALTSELTIVSDYQQHISSHTPPVTHLWGLTERILGTSTTVHASVAGNPRLVNACGADSSDRSTQNSASLLGDLISALLDGLTRDSDDQMRLLYAQWLGNLGAIDPSRLPLSNHKTSIKGSIIYVSDNQFSFHILCELAKIYLRAASPKQLDSTALAIQELLRLFNVHDGRKTPLTSKQTNPKSESSSSKGEANSFVSGAELWNAFPEHLWDLFSPLLTSRYAVESFTDWSQTPSPLIGTDEEMTFETWIRLWSGALSAEITTSHVFNLFRFCEPVVKTDAGFARFVLEHAALQVLLDNATKGIWRLQTEVIAVLKATGESEGYGEWPRYSVDDILMSASAVDTHSDAESSSNPTNWKSWFPFAAQTVFGLLDYLQSWFRANGKPVKPPVQSTRSAQVDPQAAKRVQEFLSRIPNMLQAKASLRCGDLPRALLHWELAYAEDAYVKTASYYTGLALAKNNDIKTKGKNKENLFSANGVAAIDGLLDTYASLRDSDGLAGVLATRQHIGKADHPPETPERSSDKSGRYKFTTLRALELENEGQLDMAAAAYEHNLALTELDCVQSAADARRLVLYGGLFRCQLSDPARLHGLVERAGALIGRSNLEQGHLGAKNNSVWVEQLNAYRSEAAWRLSDWDTLRRVPQSNASYPSWSVGLGNLFLAISEQKQSSWPSILSQLRISQMNELSAAALEGPGGYTRAYETVARLSALSDVELIADFQQCFRRYVETGSHTSADVPLCLRSVSDGGRMHEADLESKLKSVLSLLDYRLEISQPMFHTMEPCLAMQHTALQLLLSDLRSSCSVVRDTAINAMKKDLRAAIGQNWLKRAKLARKYKQFMAAYTCVLRAEVFGIPHALIERAKLLWTTDKRDSAQACLDEGIPQLYTCQDCDGADLDNCIQMAMLLRARYSEETSRFDFEATRKMYEEVCNKWEGCEEAHFRLARYVDRACSLATVATQYDSLLKSCLTHYGLALSYGNQFIYQSMPRLLSLWLDYGTDYARRFGRTNTKTAGQHSADPNLPTFNEVQTIMLANIQRIPAYQFYTALGQLLSRVCHDSPSVVSTLIDLLVRIFEAYPLQTIWFLMPLNDSTVRQRRERCQQIFNLVKSKQSHLTKFISDTTTLCGHLRTICGLFMSADRRELRNFSLRQFQRPLTRLVESSDFSNVLIPIHRQLVPHLLPARASHEAVQRHWPFGPSPDHLVCLARMEDTVDILGSQTRPKKMTWIGSDGRSYIIVAKPNDDLRKDSRLMELNGVINKFLIKNADSRQRRLQIRTYAVIPLSEKGGLIEWVSNTEPFRTIITKLYQEAGRPINWAAMSRVAPLLDDPLHVKRDKYLNKWLPMFPLVFHRWFLDTFPNPTAWYSARECYARTSAVMSMVGYVLGLGDRHTENILFDSMTGGVVHVDFSCVFNNGLTLPWPERVPFRLTRNMVHALGPTGYEGVFRRCAEIVMRLLRHEVDPLLAVFRPIYFDALVESGGRGGGAGLLDEKNPNIRRPAVESDLAERVGRAAADKLNGMQDRLHGKITEHDGFSQILPMSAEGQVDALIKEATSVDQLCQMYKGWMPFL